MQKTLSFHGKGIAFFLLIASITQLSFNLLCFEPIKVFDRIQSSMNEKVNKIFTITKKVFDQSTNEYMVSFWMKANFDVQRELIPISLSDGKRSLPFIFTLYNGENKETVSKGDIGSLQVNNDLYFEMKSGEWVLVIIEVLNLKNTVFYIVSVGTPFLGLMSKQVDIDVEFIQPLWHFFTDGFKNVSQFDGTLEEIYRTEQILPSQEMKQSFFRTPTKLLFFSNLNPEMSSTHIENFLEDIPQRLWKEFLSTAQATGFEDFKFEDGDLIFQDPFQFFRKISEENSNKMDLSIQKEKTSLSNLILRQKNQISLNSDNAKLLFKFRLAFWLDVYENLASDMTLDIRQKKYFKLKEVILANMKSPEVLSKIRKNLLMLRVLNNEALDDRENVGITQTSNLNGSERQISNDFGWILNDNCHFEQIQNELLSKSRSYMLFWATDFFVNPDKISTVSDRQLGSSEIPLKRFKYSVNFFILKQKLNGHVEFIESKQLEFFVPEKMFLSIESVLIKFYDIRDEQKNKIVSLYVNATLVDNLIIDQEFDNQDLHFVGNRDSFDGFVNCRSSKVSQGLYAKLKNFMAFSGSSTDSFNICSKDNKIMSSSFSTNAVMFKCKNSDIYSTDLWPKTQCNLTDSKSSENESSITSESLSISFDQNVYANLLSILFLNKNYEICERIPAKIEYEDFNIPEKENQDTNCNQNCISCFKEKCYRCKKGFELVSFSYCKKFSGLIFNKFTQEYESVFEKLILKENNKFLLSTKKRIIKNAFLIVNFNLRFENKNEESIIDFFIQNKKMKTMINIPEKYSSSDTTMNNSSTLYWGIYLEDLRTFSRNELQNSKFSSYEEYLKIHSNEEESNFLLLHFEIQGKQNISLSEIKYKILDQKQICPSSSFFSLDFDCNSNCIDSSQVNTINNRKFISLSNETSNQNKEQISFYSYIEPLFSNKKKCLKQCPIGYFPNKLSKQCQICPEGCVSCTSKDECNVCHLGFFLNKVSYYEYFNVKSSVEEFILGNDHLDGINIIKVPKDEKTENEENNNNSSSSEEKDMLYIPPTINPKPTVKFIDSVDDSLNTETKEETLDKVQFGKTLCSKCSDNCLRCSSPETCEMCKEGFYFDNSSKTCKTCDITCAECQGPKKHHCIRCRTGAYLSTNGECYECESSCGSCSDSPTNCSTCSKQFAFANSFGYCHSNTLKSMIYIEKTNTYIPCSGCLKCTVDFHQVCGLCPICQTEADIQINMYQINPPIIQVDFGVDSLRKTNVEQYINIRSKDTRENYDFEIVENQKGSIWVKIHLDRVIESVGLEQQQLDCEGDFCKFAKVLKYKKSIKTETSIDLEILFRQGIIKRSEKTFFNGRTVEHTLNFVPNYNKYICKINKISKYFSPFFISSVSSFHW